MGGACCDKRVGATVTPREMRNLFEPQAQYRNADPGTSRDAAISTEQSGGAATWRLRVLQAVRDWPGLTAGEYADRMDVPREKVHKRLSEIREKGYARNGAARPCNLTHIRAMTWWPVEGER